MTEAAQTEAEKKAEELKAEIKQIAKEAVEESITETFGDDEDQCLWSATEITDILDHRFGDIEDRIDSKIEKRLAIYPWANKHTVAIALAGASGWIGVHGGNFWMILYFVIAITLIELWN